MLTVTLAAALTYPHALDERYIVQVWSFDISAAALQRGHLMQTKSVKQVKLLILSKQLGSPIGSSSPAYNPCLSSHRALHQLQSGHV